MKIVDYVFAFYDYFFNEPTYLCGARSEICPQISLVCRGKLVSLQR